MPKLFSLCLFFSSFLPLWVSVIFIDALNIYKKDLNLWTEKISITIIFLMIFLSIYILRKGLKVPSSKEHCRSYTIKKVKEEKSITAGYLITYILPMSAFDFTRWDKVILFLVFFCTIAYLTVKYNHFSINILLEIIGFRLYTCTLENSEGYKYEWTIISRQNLIRLIEEDIDIKSINNEFKLAVFSES